MCDHSEHQNGYFSALLVQRVSGMCHILLLLDLPQHLLEPNIACIPVHQVFSGSNESKVFPRLCVVQVVCVTHCYDTSLVV